MQAGPQSRLSSKDGGTSQRHGQVREDTAEGQRVRRESHDRERCKEGEEDGDGGDDGRPPDRAGSSEEITGNPHDNAASSRQRQLLLLRRWMGTTDRRRNPMEGRCDLEPEFKRARVGDDVEMCAVDEEDGPVTGDILEPRLVAAARSEETRYMNDIGMFEDATDEECLTNTGKPPVDTKWVDVNKGSRQDPVVRSRLVARDFKPKGETARGDLFAAMPPLEAKKVLFAIGACHPWVMRDGRLQRPKLMFIDVKEGAFERNRQARGIRLRT